MNTRTVSLVSIQCIVGYLDGLVEKEKKSNLIRALPSHITHVSLSCHRDLLLDRE